MAFKLLAEVVTKVDGGNAAAAGRWRINAGSEMITTVPGLNDDDQGKPRPIRLVLDLASATFRTPRIVALSEHGGHDVVGYWDAFAAKPEEGIFADLHLAKPADENEAQVLSEAVRLNALIKNDIPIQASIGAEAGASGSWERVEAGKSVTLNGRTYSGDGSLPLFVLRGGEIYETSIVTFGADSSTGRVAASKKPTPVNKGNPMLKAMLGKYPEKHHGLIARCVAENLDEPTIAQKVHAAEIDEKDKKIAEMESAIKSLQAIIDQQGIKAKDGDEDADDKAKKAAAAASSHGVKFTAKEGEKRDQSPPLTLTAAMARMRAEGCSLTAFALRREARRLYPDAKEA